MTNQALRLIGKTQVEGSTGGTETTGEASTTNEGTAGQGRT